MPRITEEKSAVVAEVRDKLSAADAVIITEYRGMTVSALATLRRSLRPLGAEYRVVKNTLARFGAREAGATALEEMLKGPSAITFVKGDPSAVAKVLRDAAKDNPSLVVKGGIVSGKTVGAKELKALADLPPRDVMLAQFAGLLQAPLVRTANMFAALPRKAAYGLKALVDSKAA
ncbi:MAG: ribosomal protein [Actinomycetota bacterium]